VVEPQISHIIDCFSGSFCLNRLCSYIAQPSYEVKTAGGGGTNSISNFDHHNINVGAVDNT
jgi:hypothetical protein